MESPALVKAVVSAGYPTANIQESTHADESSLGVEPRLLVTANQPTHIHNLCRLLQKFGFPVAVVHEEGDAIVRILAYRHAHNLLVTSGTAERALIQPLRLVERLRDTSYEAPVHLHTTHLTSEETQACHEADVDHTCCSAVRNVSLLEGMNSLISIAPHPGACLSILQLRN